MYSLIVFENKLKHENNLMKLFWLTFLSGCIICFWNRKWDKIVNLSTLTFMTYKKVYGVTPSWIFICNSVVPGSIPVAEIHFSAHPIKLKRQVLFNKAHSG